jgi:hypothetical protein
MRKIYGKGKDGIATAWIGESAPIPDGWSTDINAITEVENGVQEKRQEPEEVELDIEDILTSSESDAELGRKYGVPWQTIKKIKKDHAE